MILKEDYPSITKPVLVLLSPPEGWLTFAAWLVKQAENREFYVSGLPYIPHDGDIVVIAAGGGKYYYVSVKLFLGEDGSIRDIQVEWKDVKDDIYRVQEVLRRYQTAVSLAEDINAYRKA